MVFPSIPAYLDPSNWQQQPSHQIRGESSSTIIQQNPQLLPPPPPPPPRPPPPAPPQHPHVIGSGGGGGMDMISPRSMSERARLANIPIPEAALNCPRCESTNTKFCYFNNYNLTQPRHFCKTCRRYWTRGGALRSVPVGGGCRRNKRSKNTTTNSKSMSTTTSTTDRHTPSSSTGTISSYSGGGGGSGGRPTGNTLLDLTPMVFTSPLGQLSDQNGVNNFNYSSSSCFLMGDHHHHHNHNTSSHEMNYQMGCNNLIGSGSLEQWRLNHHLQLLGGLNNNNNNSSSLGNGLYQFQTVVPSSGFVGETSRDEVIIRDQNKPSNSVLNHHHHDHHHHHQQQLDSITTITKMEENQGLTINLMGNPTSNAWAGNDNGSNGNGNGNGGGAAATWSDYLTRFSNRNP